MRLIFLIPLFFSAFSWSQTDMGNLEIDSLVESSLKGGEEHQFTVVLENDRFVYIEAMQEGVDVVIHVQNPDGRMLGRFDSPNGVYGLEKVLFNAETAGNYTVYVDPISAQSREGNYSITLKKNDPIGTDIEAFTDQLLFQQNNEGPGASIAVVKDGRLEFSKGYGLANLEYGVANEPATVFHIASISKQFTAFAILLLQEQGKLSIDDDIRKYIPEMYDFGKPITLRHLANHTSGLRDQWNLLSIGGWRFDDLITTDDILHLLYQQRSLNFQPGEEMLYCNSGFTLLAEVVKRVSGLTFAEFTQKHIFDPLGMRNTQFYDDHQKIVKNRAYSYSINRTTGDYQKEVLNYANVGATSLFTTVEDLAFWTLNFEDPLVGSEETFKIMHTSATLNNGDSTGYAMGQSITDLGGIPNYAHGGSDAGFRTFLTRFPDQNISVIVFSNQAEFNPGNIADAISKWYLKDQIKPKKPGESNDYQMPLSQFEKFIGRYEIAPGMDIDIFAEYGRYYGQATGQNQVEMIPVGKNEFKMPELHASAKFIRRTTGEYSKVELTFNGELAVAKRLPEFDPQSVIPSDYLGTFYSKELKTYYDLIVVDDVLTLSHRKIGQYAMDPLREDQFKGRHWLFTKVAFLRDQKGDVSGFTVSNGRARNMLFTKVVRH